MFKLVVMMAVIGTYMAAGTYGFTLHFKNKCTFPVWPAVGKASNGRPDSSVSYGTKLNPGGESNFGVSDHEIGSELENLRLVQTVRWPMICSVDHDLFFLLFTVRSWGRTGCDANGANCATGG
jgi:hypothetical protein